MLKEIDAQRRRCGNISGAIESKFKVLSSKAIGVIEVLLAKLAVAGGDDSSFLKMRVTELNAMVSKAKKEEEVKAGELKIMEEEVKGLRAKIREMETAARRSEERIRLVEETLSLPGNTTRKGKKGQSYLTPNPRDKMMSRRRASTAGDSAPSTMDDGATVDDGDAKLDSEIRKKISRMDRDIAIMMKRRETLAGGESGMVHPPPSIKAKPQGKRTRSRIASNSSGPRIVENIQLVPPRNTRDLARLDREADSQSEGWIVVDRRGKSTVPPRGTQDDPGVLGRALRMVGDKVRKRKPPKTAAVVISARSGDFSYSDALKKTRESISLTEMGISKPKLRVTVNGDRLIEIPGPDGARLADELASELRNLFKDEEHISRPYMKGELRLIGLDDSVSSFEIMEVMAEAGGCKSGEVKVGQLRPMSNGLRSAWVQCPLAAAVSISAQGKVRIGWSMIRVELLKARPPLQCYRCWEFGYVRRSCKAESDRSKNCFRCGRADHVARSCQEAPFCVLCADRSKRSDHRLGSATCPASEFRRLGPAPLARDNGGRVTSAREGDMEVEIN